MESRVFEGQAYLGYAPQQQAAAYWYPPQQQGYGYPPPRQGEYRYPPQQHGYGYSPPWQGGHWYPSQQQGGYGYPPSQQGGYGYPPQGVVQPEQVNNFRDGLGQGLQAGWELFGDDITSDVGDRVAAFVDGNADNYN